MQSISMDMLDLAKQAAPYFGARRDDIVAFLKSQLTPEGGFCDRAGDADLYYSVFGIDCMLALGEPLPTQQLQAYLTTFGDGEDLDFMHLTCLARCWARVAGTDAPEEVKQNVLNRIERFRTSDGGYSTDADASQASVTGIYLAIAAYQDAELEVPQAELILNGLRGLHSRDGAFGDEPDMEAGTTPVTGGALILQHRLDGEVDKTAAEWLWQQASPAGGFVATPEAPVPDLLSSATAILTAAELDYPLALTDSAADTVFFTESLQADNGGFQGHPLDDTPDCEYTYYALVTLGGLLGGTGIVSTDFLGLLSDNPE